MRRRFSRGKRGSASGESKSGPIDGARVFERLSAAGLIEPEGLVLVDGDEVPDNFAVVATGSRDGEKVVVGFAPRNGGDAAAATVAVAQRLAEDGFDGDAIAVAPQWTGAARRRLAALDRGALPFRLSAIANTALGDERGTVEPESIDSPLVVPLRRVAAALPRAAERELFQRCVAAFEGLAAKHGGAVRGVDGRVDLVLLARRVAALHAKAGGIQLEVWEGERSNAPLSVDRLATEMDRLEGLLRKRLNDRRLRGSEEGLRSQLGPALAEVAGVRNTCFWPVGGSNVELVDLVGVHDDGRPVVGVIRERLTLAGLCSVLDAVLALRQSLPTLLADASPPLVLGMPRLLVAAKSYDAPALRLLNSLVAEHAAFDVKPRRGGEPFLELREGQAATAVTTAGALVEAERDESDALAAPQPPGGEGRSRSRGRRGGRRPRPAAVSEEGDTREEIPETGGFDEISLFDLADDPRSAAETGEEGPGRRSRRGRGRGRRRRGRSSSDSEEAVSPEAGEGGDEEPSLELEDDLERDRIRRSAGRQRGRGQRPAPEEGGADTEEGLDDADDIEDLSETLAPLDDVPDLGDVGVPAYEEEEEEEEEDDLTRRRREAELRARARRDEEPGAEPEERLSLPRKRAAIVVHTDRASLIAGILLARDLRQIEGLWVYGQEDLMTFFRGVATDLREDTTIYVIGFTASPARDALQAASLYRGRLAWFDHHEWPPEDLGAMRDTLGRENVHVVAGAENSLSEVLSMRTRRSRFSDKVVELATGSFSEHDYERWGRVWWNRLGSIAKRTGDRRADVDALLVGRPSELAKEAAMAPPPPEPPEIGFVAGRDFRLVHFGGYTMVVLTTPEDVDPHLASRIARERYGAQISLAGLEGTDLVILGGEEGRSRRSIDLSGMVDHLDAKHDWIVALPSEDHVARIRLRDLAHHPERFDELVSEIAMGRSILEG